MIPVYSDRAKDALIALLAAGTPRIDFFTTYRARVITQSPDLLRVDIKPDDARIPSRQGVPIKWGIPGLKAQIAPGAYVNHGWDNGDPTRPYVALIESNASVLKAVITGALLQLNGTQIKLGSDAAVQKAVLGTAMQAALVGLLSAGGAALTNMATDPLFSGVFNAAAGFAGTAGAAFTSATAALSAAVILSPKVTLE